MTSSFGVQKAKHLFLELDKKKPVLDVAMMFEKHDGWFGYFDLPSCAIHSRAQREIPAVKELSDKIRAKRPEGVKGRLIFEIMIEGLEIDSFHELNGILNRKSEQAEGAYLRVHDFIPDFNFCSMPAHKRYAFATEIVHRIGLPEVMMSPILGISGDVDKWHRTAETVQSWGGEGLILKALNGQYTAGKRISTLMKIKEEVTVEMLVKKVVEAEGEHEGMVGKLVCLDDKGILHDVGAGCLKHSERISYFQDPSLILGAVVEIKAMKKLADGKYREPRFKAIRHDKGAHELG